MKIIISCQVAQYMPFFLELGRELQHEHTVEFLCLSKKQSSVINKYGLNAFYPVCLPDKSNLSPPNGLFDNSITNGFYRETIHANKMWKWIEEKIITCDFIIMLDGSPLNDVIKFRETSIE